MMHIALAQAFERKLQRIQCPRLDLFPWRNRLLRADQFGRPLCEFIAICRLGDCNTNSSRVLFCSGHPANVSRQWEGNHFWRAEVDIRPYE